MYVYDGTDSFRRNGEGKTNGAIGYSGLPGKRLLKFSLSVCCMDRKSVEMTVGSGTTLSSSSSWSFSTGSGRLSKVDVH